MKPEIVFALYRPHEGKDAELRELIKKHMPTLRRLELVTDRIPILVKSKRSETKCMSRARFLSIISR